MLIPVSTRLCIMPHALSKLPRRPNDISLIKYYHSICSLLLVFLDMFRLEEPRDAELLFISVSFGRRHSPF